MRSHIHNFTPFTPPRKKDKEKRDSCYCVACGSIKHNGRTTVTSGIFQAKPEVDPKLIFIETASGGLAETRNSKTINPYYKDNRKKMINFIKEIANRCELTEREYHLIILILDTLYIEHDLKEDIEKTTLTVILIIIKFFVSDRAASLEYFLFHTQNDFNSTFTKEIFAQTEREILKVLDYDLMKFHTAFDYLSLMLNNGIIFEDEITNEKIKKNLNHIYCKAVLLLNNFVENISFLKFSPLQIAFTVTMAIRVVAGLKNEIDFFCDFYNYSFDQFKNCYNFVLTSIRVPPNKRREVKPK